jgi:hypothetical protein
MMLIALQYIELKDLEEELQKKMKFFLENFMHQLFQYNLIISAKLEN